MSSENNRHQLADVVDEFDNAMFITQTEDGQLRGRPMAIAKYRQADTLYFATDDDSGKIDEMSAHPNVAVVMQGGARYVSLSGRCEVVRDRKLIEECWSPAWKVWFPEGPEDPSLVLIKFDAGEGEYWDNSGLNKLKYLYEAGKAVFAGERLEVEDDDIHAKVSL